MSRLLELKAVQCHKAITREDPPNRSLCDEMNRHDAISEAVLDAMPGWGFESPLHGFGWAPNRHLRAALGKADRVQRVVVRQSWTVSGFETERYLYDSLLADLPFKTPRLLATFTLNSDEPPWSILEDIGERTVADEPEKRRLFLQVLACLHGHGRRLCEEGQLDDERLRRFPANHPYYNEWEAVLENGLSTGKYALPNTVLSSLCRLREELAQEPQTLIHGDTDFSNAMLTSEGMALIDWEWASIGPASVDLGNVVSPDDLHDDMQLYRMAYCEASGDDMRLEEALRIGGLGVLFDALRWVCYYVRQVEEGNDPGEEWRRVRYEPRLERVRAAALPGDVLASCSRAGR